MNLYCRESISKYVIENKNLIMEATNKSIEFYEKFFQVKYQFPKYEQVFCPEFNSGAMENAGIVTIND